MTSRRRFTLFLIYLRQTSAALLIYQPVFIPFLLGRGMNMIDVALLQTVYNLGVLAFDIPTGYAADRFGRKWALAGTNLALAIGTAFLAFGHSLGMFIVAELFYSVAIAFDSGTHSAYLFEWLRRQKLESEYYRFDARGTFIFLSASTVGTFVAGYFAERNLMIPVAATIGLTFIGFPAACLLPDDGSAEDSTDARPNAAAGKRRRHVSPGDIARLARHVLVTPHVRWAAGVTVLWFWARQYINFIISQPYFHSINLHFRDYGMLYSVLTLTSGLIAFFSRRFVQTTDLRKLTAAGLLLIPTCFAIMGLSHTKAGLAGFFLFAVPYGLCAAVTNTLLNRAYTEHDSRATFLSVVDTAVRLVASMLALVLGWVLARHGASAALLRATAVAGAIVVALLPGLRRYTLQEP